jgi:hypothetical protein
MLRRSFFCLVSVKTLRFSKVVRTRRSLKQPKLPRIPKSTAILRKLWNDKKSLRANYLKVGLSLAPNEVVSRTHRQLRRSGHLPPDVDENVQIPDDPNKEVLKKILGVPEAADPRPPKLGVRERVYIRRLIDKYGTNYVAMARDMKLNYNQYTKKELKKKCQVYEQFYRNPVDYKALRQQAKEEKRTLKKLKNTGDHNDTEENNNELTEDSRHEETSVSR